MATEAQPVPGTWYLNTRSQERFQVVGIDADEESVEVQHQNGNLDHIPLDYWYELDVRPAEQPLDANRVLSDTREAMDANLTGDPHALGLPSAQERYRRENVEYAGSNAPGSPDPRPEHGPDRPPERGSERGVEQWPETRE